MGPPCRFLPPPPPPPPLPQRDRKWGLVGEGTGLEPAVYECAGTTLPFSMFVLPMNSPEWGNPGKLPKKMFQLGEGNYSVSLWREGMLKPFVPCTLTNYFSVSGSRLLLLFLILLSSLDKECPHTFGYQKTLFPIASYPAPSPLLWHTSSFSATAPMLPCHSTWMTSVCSTFLGGSLPPPDQPTRRRGWGLELKEQRWALSLYQH